MSRYFVRTATWRFFNSRLGFGLIVLFMVVAPFVWQPDWPLFPSKVTLGSSLNGHPFTSGVLQSSVAALLIAWAAYIWRVKIRRFFQPQLIYIRAPLMLGVAPLIIARSRDVGIWERHGLNMDLDFRYAGRKALEDLYSPDNPCPLAVASDVALSTFLGHKDYRDSHLSVIPFVRIKDHLKIIVRRNNRDGSLEFSRVGDLKGKRIGYYPDSVHNDFLDSQEIFDTSVMVELTSVMDCFRTLVVEPRGVDACVLWEPHYHAFKDIADVGIINDTDATPYEWFLCLVAKAEYTKTNEAVAQKIVWAMRDATAYCEVDRNHQSVIRDCASFLHTEFTGITRDGLETLLNRKQHEFGVEEILVPFRNKLMTLIEKGGDTAVGANNLAQSLWEGLEH